MRTIKFRGKDHRTGEWFYGNLFDEDTYGRTHISTTERGCLDIDPETVGQYTGLKDSKRNEIYEGDIVRISIRPTQETAMANTRNAELMGIKMPSWIDGGDIIARESYFDGVFHFIHLQSYLPQGSKNTQEPMLNYLFYERHPDASAHYNQEMTVIDNIHDNPQMLKGGLND